MTDAEIRAKRLRQPRRSYVVNAPSPELVAAYVNGIFGGDFESRETRPRRNIRDIV